MKANRKVYDPLLDGLKDQKNGKMTEKPGHLGTGGTSSWERDYHLDTEN